MSTLRAAGDVAITAEGNGKTRGYISRKQVQYPTAAPWGWLNGSTFGVLPDAVRWRDKLDLQGNRVGRCK